MIIDDGEAAYDLASLRPSGIFRFIGIGNENAVGTIANQNHCVARSCCFCRNGNYMGTHTSGENG
jgi:hypothetical protein